MLERSKSGMLMAGGLDYPEVADLRVGDEVRYHANRRGRTVPVYGKVTEILRNVGILRVTRLLTDVGDNVLAQDLIEVKALWNGEPRYVGIPDPC